MMAGMEDYFGPRRKGAFDNFDLYDESNEEIIFNRPNQRWDGRQEGNLTYRPSRPNALRPEQRDLLMPSPAMMKQNRSPDNSEEELLVLKHVKTGVSVATLIAENLLSHPFVVLRRQCQVHNCSQRFHLFPVTLFPVMWRLNQRQGFTTLWKGLGSVFLVRGMSMAVEDVISKFTPWPKEFKSHSSLKAHGQHIMLKCLTLAIVTPFYSASLVETVQSDIASEKPGVFDVFREGICRLISWSSPQKGRMLPVWDLVIPSVVFGLLRYLIGIMIRNMTSRMLQLSYEINLRKRVCIEENELFEDDFEGAVPKEQHYLNQASAQDIETTAGFMATVGTEIILYPLETILHRLHLQGTRTIIDNLDSGTQVVPILTSYEGTVDCYHTTLREEGVPGLYKGFGALLLQFAAHYLLIKVTKAVVTQAAHIFFSNPPPPPTTVELRDIIDLKNQKPLQPLEYNTSEA